MNKWTKKQPTDTGWYWFRVMEFFEPTPIYVTKLEGGMRARLGQDCWVHIARWKGEWWSEQIQSPTK